MATTDQNITELPIKTASEVSDADYLMGIDLVEGYQVLTKDFADYVVNEAEITVGGKKQTTANAISEIGTTASNAQPKESGKGLSTNDYTTSEKNKLAGIASGAEVNVNADWTASSGDAQILHKPTTIAGYGITDAYTKTQVDGFVSEIDDVIKTDEIVSEDSNPITIVTESAQIAKSTKVTFEPTQDLHGYDHPWPAGGGKNLIPMTVDGIKAVNSGTRSGNSITINGVTFTIMTDNAGNVTGINVNGTASADTYFHLSVSSKTLYSESSIASLESSIYPCVLADSYSGKFRLSSGALNFTGGESTIEPTIIVSNGVSVSNVLAKPMIRLSTESDATFEPYSNICPISGLDSVEVKRTGKNLFDEKYEGISGSLVYTPIFVGNNTVTLSTTPPQSGGGRNLFLLTGKATTGASSALNGVSVNVPKSEQATDGYVTVAYRNEANIDPRNYQTQLELGSTATDYEPYTESVSSLDLPEPVYSGTIDLETGEFVADMGMVDLGSLTWLNNKYGQNAYESYSVNSLVKPNTTNLLSNVLVQKSSFVDVAEYTIRMGNDFLAVKVPKSVASDSVNMKQWLTDNNVVLCYELATPITYTLTPKQLSLLKGTNHISTNAKSVKVAFRNGKLALMEDIPQQLAIEEKKTDEKLNDLLTILAPLENGTTASKAYTTGQYFMHDGQFCKAKTNIASGATFTLNTNYEVTTVGAEIYTALHS